MSRWANKYVIGLTGNIAVGKSVVRQMLQHLGAYTIDADGLTHQAMAPGAPAYAPVVDYFGKFVLDASGSVDRARLGHIVFAYPDALARQEAIIHPVVIQAINTLVSRAKQRIIVIEAIKLLESDLNELLDTLWVVDAAPDTQVRRLVEKRRFTEQDARRRISIQPAQALKLAKATRVIKNDGSVDDTWKQVQAAWEEVKRAVSTGTGEHAAAATNNQPRPITQLASQSTPSAQTIPLTPAPAAAPGAPADAGAFAVSIRRGMPGNAELIARFITETSGTHVDRMDIMLAFGQKSYLLALDGAEQAVAVMGWQVENLITRVDEFYLKPSAPKEATIAALVAAVEEASKELQSEVGFIFLPSAAGQDIVGSFVGHGYELVTLKDIRVPTWLEAVQDFTASNPRILMKKLRADRVMKPI